MWTFRLVYRYSARVCVLRLYAWTGCTFDDRPQNQRVLSNELTMIYFVLGVYCGTNIVKSANVRLTWNLMKNMFVVYSCHQSSSYDLIMKENKQLAWYTIFKRAAWKIYWIKRCILFIWYNILWCLIRNIKYINI